MAIHIYGENGITVKVAVKLETQKNGYRNLMKLLKHRYLEMHNEVNSEDFKGSKEKSCIYLFPNFGKAGRRGKPEETCFGEPDMIISTQSANLLFEFETKSFLKLLHIPKKGKLKNNSLAYQLCRFYQLGELLDRLDKRMLRKDSSRRVRARYHFLNKSGREKTHYYFNFRGEYYSSPKGEKRNWTHSFEKMADGLLGRKRFYVVSVTKDSSYEEALQGLNKMLEKVGKANYKLCKFIVLTYNDLQSNRVFGESLQFDLKKSRQGFQEINIPTKGVGSNPKGAGSRAQGQTRTIEWEHYFGRRE